MADVLAGQMLTPDRLVPAVVHQWRLRTFGKGLKRFEGYLMTGDLLLSVGRVDPVINRLW